MAVYPSLEDLEQQRKLKEVVQEIPKLDFPRYWNAPVQHVGAQQIVTKDPQPTGMKYDNGKLRFGLLTRSLAAPLASLAAVMSFGAQKYADNSWQTVPNGKARYEEALDRHLNAWKQGEERDQETGLHHLSHAAINVLFLLWFTMQDLPGDYTTFIPTEKK